LKFFDKDEIEWSENILLTDFYKTLLCLHKTGLVYDGETFNLPVNNPHVMAFLRKKDDDVLLVLLNFSGDEQVKVTVEHNWIEGMFENVFSDLQHHFNSKEEFELMDYDYLVYRKINAK
jgi:glycosidase